MRILVVEDEPRIAAAMRRTLEREGHSVTVANHGKAAVNVLGTWRPDLVLLDLMLPDMDGTDLARHIRTSSAIPIIMITSLGREADKVAGLDAGADDYLVKPFGSDELRARIRAVTRRLERSPAEPARWDNEGLQVDEATRGVSVDGIPIDLSKREFEILRMLIERPGEVVTRAAITHALWGTSSKRAGKSLDTHMSSLRRKLGDDPMNVRFIQTVHGVGFRLATRPPASAG